MKHKVCVVTGTRADYGLLKELLLRLKNNSEVELILVVTGSHLSESFGNTQDEIIQDGFKSYHSISIPMDDDSKCGMAIATGEALCRFAEFFSKVDLDLLVVLGDRYEILSAVIAAGMSGIPVAHISGGDITEGAIDDSIRHCITKMSQIHFPGCEQSRLRIIQMGENPNRVFNVGEPGVENALRMKLLSREELSDSIGFDGVLKDYIVVTFHPVTLERNTGIEQTRELIKAMDSILGMNYIVTLANADAGGRAINDIWITEGKSRSNWCVVPSLGVKRYLSAMKYSKMVLGNSSSGIIEAPSMKVPTVNIGDRQKGRMQADSIINCNPNADNIVTSIKKALTDDFKSIMQSLVSPFGDGTTSVQVERHVIDFLRESNHSLKKPFYDISFDLKEKF